MIKQTLASHSFKSGDVQELARIKREPNLDWLKRAYHDFGLQDFARDSRCARTGVAVVA